MPLDHFGNSKKELSEEATVENDKRKWRKVLHNLKVGCFFLSCKDLNWRNGSNKCKSWKEQLSESKDEIMENEKHRWNRRYESLNKTMII